MPQRALIFQLQVCIFKETSFFTWTHFAAVGLQVQTEPEFYGDLVYKFRKIIDNNKIIMKKIIVFDGVFLCCPFSHEISWMRSGT